MREYASLQSAFYSVELFLKINIKMLYCAVGCSPGYFGIQDDSVHLSASDIHCKCMALKKAL
jgi:hypothetical protein